ncbi:MAG: rhodanese-like domain-containing protein [Chthoniobacterales bacterium]|nr:rhodanese-like domain-containing protein [Chthoniobacterales bacterium]
MLRLARESGVVLVGALAALGLGFLGNSLRKHPLPMTYENPQKRLVKLVAGEGGEIAEPGGLDFPEVQEAWKAGEALFVDARTADFFAEGHIPRSVNLPRASLLQKGRLPTLPEKSRTLIVYCSGEDCADSKLVAQGLLLMGFKNVSVYSGGWEEWEASGSPVEK